MFTEIGRERGWPPASLGQFEAMCGPAGAFLIGAPETVAAKILGANDTLGGIDRVTFQMSSAALAHEAMSRSIELLGTAVAARVRSVVGSGPQPHTTQAAHG
jgi:alkanesulfonate monooxygenase SsuD/methylene tetrahydromethanopterin reductase-like flavin-dependent oxidoreductase (luciferase family)